MSNLSLLHIIRDNPDLAKRLEEGTQEVRQSKENLVSAANDFNEKYRGEIEEGTEKRKLLLEYGKQQGKTEDEVLGECGNFIPCKSTPIMNFLFFLMRDGNKADWIGIQKDLNTQYGHSDTTLNEVISEKELDRIYKQLVHDEEQYNNVKEPQDLDRYIYGNLSHDMFKRMKKLKALSKSENQNEAFLAYRLCIKLCEKYGLEFDKVPCNVE